MPLKQKRALFVLIMVLCMINFSFSIWCLYQRDVALAKAEVYGKQTDEAINLTKKISEQRDLSIAAAERWKTITNHWRIWVVTHCSAREEKSL